MKKRNLVIAALLMLALVVTGATYAYWAGNVLGNGSSTNNNSVTIGQGHDVQTTVAAAVQTADVNLVPTKHVAGSTTDRVILTFSVLWAGAGTNADDAIGAKATLSGVVSNIKIGGAAINGDGLNGAMFIITPEVNKEIIAGTAIDFTVTVVFANEPKDKATYDLVADKNVTFDIAFTAAV